MKVHNTRSIEQWDILNRAFDDWQGKLVIDLGCGYCDIATMATFSGAYSTGVDKEYLFTEHSHVGKHIQAQLDEFISAQVGPYDIAICFSVLPYLDDPMAVLRWMSQNAEVSFIECQYYKDGPGFEYIMNDDDMRLWLEDYWNSVTPIGKTHVEIRDTFRTIWMCKDAVN